MIIAIGNVGSTSLKSKIIDIDDRDHVTFLGEANLDRVKSPGESTFTHRVGDAPRDQDTVDICGFDEGINHILEWYVASRVIDAPADIEAVGFKTVMGLTNGANELTPDILDEMRRFLFVAPVHNGPYIEVIEQFRRILDVPMVGVFEPSFHWSMPEFRRYMGLPWRWHEDLGIRNLGFHGASHRYLGASAYRLLGSRTGRVLSVHLGGSSSLCAIRDGLSVDISTHFSPNAGTLQGARTGDLDGTALLFAMKELGLTADEAQHAISTEAGLKGMAGIGTDDVRDIERAAAEGNRRAEMAVQLFVDGVRKHVGAFATVLGRLDAIVFGGGIGENDPEIRARCLADMEFMGISVDAQTNMACRGELADISGPDSSVRVFVVPTNEELVVAHFTRQVVCLGRDLAPHEMVFELG